MVKWHLGNKTVNDGLALMSMLFLMLPNVHPVAKKNIFPIMAMKSECCPL